MYITLISVFSFDMIVNLFQHFKYNTVITNR
uniref:Uncharacterized protein n=1 Tax=Anguilla anguilla TaxID=7936 RepID=A0A0E9QGG2_ANGAN